VGETVLYPGPGTRQTSTLPSSLIRTPGNVLRHGSDKKATQADNLTRQSLTKTYCREPNTAESSQNTHQRSVTRQCSDIVGFTNIMFPPTVRAKSLPCVSWTHTRQSSCLLCVRPATTRQSILAYNQNYENCFRGCAPTRTFGSQLRTRLESNRPLLTS
jgi:hypothetical protein